MFLVDFIYDGLKLSDFGCMVGSAVTTNSDSASMGSVVRLETVMNHGVYRSEIVNADYPDVYQAQFDIFKTPCGNGFSDVFESNEVTWFMRWLNRKDYNKFVPIFDEPKEFSKLFFMGTFTECRAITIQGQVYGFALTFTSNSPFGYLDYEPNTFDVTVESDTFTITNPTTNVQETITGGSFVIYDESEELGCTYPDSFVIKTKQAGRLVIWNECDKSNRYTEVLNCSANEILTFDCIHKVITSNMGHSGLYNDFNYVFPRLKNELYNGVNTIHVSLNSQITIDYKPIRKVGVLA